MTKIIKKQLRPYMHILTAVALVLIPTLIVMVIKGRTKVEAGWFSDSWSYRQAITINNSGTVVSYQKVSLSIDTRYTAGQVMEGKIQSGCQDSRFVDQDGKLLRYYLNTAGGACNTATTNYYVLISTINAGKTIIYHYFGNPYAQTGTEAANFSEDTFSPASTSSAAMERGESPQLNLSFDQGADNACIGGVNDACDSSINRNDGAFTNGPKWATDTMCISGKCLDLSSASNDYVKVNSATSINFDKGLSSAFTIETWVRVTTIAGNSAVIFQKGADNYLLVSSAESDRLMDLDAKFDLSTTDASLKIPNILTLDKWHHVAVSYSDDGDDEISVYVDGKLAGVSTVGSGSAAPNTVDLYLGATSSATSSLTGFLDEFKVYKNERTAAQIKNDAIETVSSKGTATYFGSPSNKFLSDDLVGYWKMDEVTGSLAYDTSGNVLTGSAGSTATILSLGKYGRSRYFNAASTAWIDAGTATDCDFNATDNFTVSAWVAFGDSGDGPYIIASKKSCDGCGAGWRFGTYQRKVFLHIEDASTNTSEIRGSTTLTAGSWYYLTAVLDRNNASNSKVYVNGTPDPIETTPNQNLVGSLSNSDRLGIGIMQPNSGRYWPINGALDEIRIYRRAFAPNEVKSLYDLAPGPIAWWKFDEGQGTGTFDSTGNLNSGSLEGTITWAPGKFGNAVNLSTTSTPLVNIVDTNINLVSSAITIEAWINPTSNGEGGAGRIFSTFSVSDYYIFGFGASNVLSFNTASGAYTSFSDALSFRSWQHVALTIDPLTQSYVFYKNGLVIRTGSAPYGLPATTSTAIGNDPDYGVYGRGFDGLIDDVRVYNYARTQKQIIEDMNGGHPIGGSPVGSQLIYWKMDEMYGSGPGTIHNNLSNKQSLSGSTTGTVWLNNTRCKIGSCIYFDGTTDTVSGGDIAETDSQSAMSISFWVNPQSLAGSQSIVQKMSANQFAWGIVTDSSNADEIRVFVSSAATSVANYFTTANLNLTSSSWQHVAVIYDGTQSAPSNRIKVFKNGINIDGTYTGTIPAITNTGTTSTLTIGSQMHAALSMFMDDFKIYTAPLTQDEVRVDYNAGSVASLGGVLGPNTDVGTLTNSGPIGLWKLDENGGQNVYDTSGSNNNGFLGTDATVEAEDPTWIKGKVGAALSFDNNIPTYVNLGNTIRIGSGQDFTVEAWVRRKAPLDSYTTIIGDRQYGGDPGFTFALLGDAFNRQVALDLDDGTNTFNIRGGDWVVDDTGWAHVAAVIDRDNVANCKIYVWGTDATTSSGGSLPLIGSLSGTDNLVIGVGQPGVGNYQAFNGLIDDIRIYNYARSISQINYDYNRGAPHFWWRFDDCEGNQIENVNADYRGTNMGVGDISPGASGNTATGACNSGTTTEMWNDGTNGKINGSLGFDGTDDYVMIRSDPSWGNDYFLFGKQFSFSAWVKYTGQHDYGTILSKFGANGNRSYRWYINSYNNSVVYNVYESGFSPATCELTSGANSVSSDTWTHLVLTHDGSTIRLFKNGAELQSGSFPGACTAAPFYGSANVRIGSTDDDSNFFEGLIDELKIFNHPLTPEQVRNDFNNGAVSF